VEAAVQGFAVGTGFALVENGTAWWRGWDNWRPDEHPSLPVLPGNWDVM